MSINKDLFSHIYENCVSIITNSLDINIKKKKVKLDSAYQILSETQDHELQEFYSIVHELRFYQYMKNLGRHIIAADDNKAGPDFNTELGYIECVCASKGATGTLERKCLDERLNQSMNRYIAALPRLSSVILDKKKKYESYLRHNKIDEKKPCIIAINSSIFSNEFNSDLNLDLILKILYGIGCTTMRFNLETNQFLEDAECESRLYEDTGLKPPKNIELQFNYFSEKEFENISGVILNNNSIGEELKKEYFCLFLNPFARCPINVSLLDNIRYFQLSEMNAQHFTYCWHNK